MTYEIEARSLGDVIDLLVGLEQITVGEQRRLKEIDRSSLYSLSVAEVRFVLALATKHLAPDTGKVSPFGGIAVTTATETTVQFPADARAAADALSDGGSDFS